MRSASQTVGAAGAHGEQRRQASRLLPPLAVRWRARMPLAASLGPGGEAGWSVLHRGFRLDLAGGGDGRDPGAMTGAHALIAVAAGRAARRPRSRRLSTAHVDSDRALLHAGISSELGPVMSPAWRLRSWRGRAGGGCGSCRELVTPRRSHASNGLS